VLARRDEIVFAEKIRPNIRTWEYIDNYGQLVEEIMASIEPKIAGSPLWKGGALVGFVKRKERERWLDKRWPTGKHPQSPVRQTGRGGSDG